MSYDSEPKKHDANCDYDPLARRFICTCKKKWLNDEQLKENEATRSAVSREVALRVIDRLEQSIAQLESELAKLKKDCGMGSLVGQNLTIYLMFGQFRKGE
jgi:hypothetical protein